MKEHKLTTYPQAARVISLYLKEFCDEGLDYVNMIADASRKAAREIEELRKKQNEDCCTCSRNICHLQFNKKCTSYRPSKYRLKPYTK